MVPKYLGPEEFGYGGVIGVSLFCFLLKMINILYRPLCLMEVTENLCSNCLRLYSHAYFFDNIMQGMIACFNYVHFSCVFI